MYSLQFYETDPARDFVRGSKWNLMPIPGILAALQLYADRPFEERWGKAAHALSRHGGKLLGWCANIDDLPEESNYVGLDFNLPDSDGLPAARVHYQLRQNSLRSMDFAGERMTEAHLTAGAVDVFTTRRMPSGHILGTARMGSDPATSVVDEYGRSHDVPNLVIVDGRVMVTGSGMNPTATITALALRAAEHLADAAANLPAQH